MDDEYRKYGTSRAADFKVSDKQHCFVCKAFVPANDINCPACGFPQNGDENAQRYFLGQLRVEKNDINRQAYGVSYAFGLLGNMTFVFLYMAYSFWQRSQVLLSQVAFIFAIVFLGIGFFGRKDPHRAFIAALIMYILISAPLIISDPMIILKSQLRIITPLVFLPLGLLYEKNWRREVNDTKDKNTG